MGTSEKLIKMEAASAKLLFTVMLFALFLSNSPLKSHYWELLNASFQFQFSGVFIHFNLTHWINEGLMTLFFLVVGLEIKYEILKGALNSRQKAILPGLAAIGGMLVPAAIFSLFTFRDGVAIRGWAIPTATDIAFSLAILSLLRHRIACSLRIFLAALAIFDDLGAIILIAIFYTDNLSSFFLQLALTCALFLVVLNISGVDRLLPYLLVGLLLWFCLLKSGIHATMAGVVLAAFVPTVSQKKSKSSPLIHLKQGLQTWVTWLVLPGFAFVNSGVDLSHVFRLGLDWYTFSGVSLGLFLGKQLGVFLACWLAVKCCVAKLPDSLSWKQLHGLAMICGTGFTMSLFINALAYQGSVNGEMYLNTAKLGILLGSFLSGMIGYLILRFSGSR